MRIDVDFGPSQGPITKASIAEMVTWKPRRCQLSHEWPNPLHEPKSPGSDWSLVLPFCETLKNAFHWMCNVDTIGMRPSKTGARCFTFFRNASDEDLENVRAWVKAVGQYVAMRDCMALSFALDYDRRQGNPKNDQTAVGSLRSVAKPYDAAATKETYLAADELAKLLVRFLSAMTCYEDANAIVAMPPSDPAKSFDLPAYLAAKVAAATGKPDLSSAVKTVKKRQSVKNSPLGEKIKVLEGTIKCDLKPLKDKNVLLLDDLYQSGVSINYVASLLLESGARRVFGLACEKTCRNDDNVKAGSK